MLLLTGAILQATCQFYDSESEVRIYCWHEGNQVEYFAFNFNGDRTAMIARSPGAPFPNLNNRISFSQLAENPNLLKERVFATGLPILTYDSSKSNSTTKAYVYKSTVSDPWEYGYGGQKYYNPYSQNYVTHKDYVKFSSSGNSFTLEGSYNTNSTWNSRTFVRVTLDELLNIYSEIQAEKERRARWR